MGFCYEFEGLCFFFVLLKTMIIKTIKFLSSFDFLSLVIGLLLPGISLVTQCEKKGVEVSYV